MTTPSLSLFIYFYIWSSSGEDNQQATAMVPSQSAGSSSRLDAQNILPDPESLTPKNVFIDSARHSLEDEDRSENGQGRDGTECENDISDLTRRRTQRLRQSSETIHEKNPQAKPPSQPSPPLGFFDVNTLSFFIIFSLFGTLARLGLNALFSYDGQSVFPLLWAQGVGCFIMGLILGRKEEIEKWGGRELYVGLGTGLCGSITTFSSWMLQTFSAFSNQSGYDRSWVHDATDGITQTIQTFAFALFSLHLGRKLSHQAPLPDVLLQPRPNPGKSITSRSIVFLTALILYLAVLFTVIFTPSSFHPGRRVTFSLLLAPPGSIVRWWLARLNGTVPRYPFLGTLSANLIATGILSASYLLQRVPGSVRVNEIQCQALQSLEDGFCGCLSTVSTFAVELDALASKTKNKKPDEEGRRGMEFAYGIGSWGAGLVVVVIVFGIPSWTLPDGLQPVCRY
ncbi:Putative fluoride ion transporter CrcB [Phaffia rhodozyma]|uniref:Putative fluoride ion transporter CrcB n=1 Tax=Phaffia rhodozyma TaxID=264483 RepID=A0A0F7SWA2_PHARH|nr:Putative fluoride ion transporter CrcB [Phaffia rhodozyma]